VTKENRIIQTVVCTLISLCFSLGASGSETIFKNYTVSDGLVNKSVLNFCQDSDGFLWIATTNGISRFDGYEFKNFTSSNGRNKSLNGTTVLDIEEGGNGKLWLSTSAGLEYYNKETETFHLLTPKNLGGYHYTGKMSINNDGTIWIPNSSSEFIVYQPQGDSLARPLVTLPLQDSATVLHNFIVRDYVLWIVYNTGIAYYDILNNKFEWIDKSEHFDCRRIRAIDSNTIVMTFTNEGVCTINTSTKKPSWITKQFLEKYIGIHSVLFDAVIEKDSSMCISVSPGLVVMKNGIVTYYNSYSEDYYFEGNSFSCLYRDKNDNIWIGTFEDGVFLKKPENNVYRFNTELYKDDVRRTRIASFHVFDNNLLLYDDTKSLYVCDNYKKLSPGCAEKILDAPLVLTFPLDERYAIASIADTAFMFDSHDKSLTPLFVAPAPACASIDDNGVIWVGTWQGKLIGYDKKLDKNYEIDFNSLNNTQYIVFAIAKDADGSLWLGTLSQGLIHVKNPTAESPVLEYYNNKASGRFFLNAEIVLNLFMDEKNNLWIGTNGNGLMKLDTQSMTFESITKKQGLKSNVIESIISDSEGNIWFTTNVVSKYSIHDKTITHFLQSGEINGSFIVKASSKSASGDLLFASSRGLYIFNSQQTSNKKATPVPVFTDFKIEGISVQVGDTIRGMVPYKKSIANSEKIELPYALNSFTIGFASIDFNRSSMCSYEYKLEGVDRDWVTLPFNNRQASYAGIQPGEYVFYVRASNDSENWSEPKTIVVRIIPPWWKTLWFRIMFILSILLIIVGVFIYRIRSMKIQNKLLEKKVKERTDSLTEANMLLQESHMVLEMKNEQIEEALKTKDKLIQVIAHDFKNPLAAMRGHLSLLKAKFFQFDAAKNQEILSSIDISASNLDLQMSTVLEWALAEKKEIVYKPIEINIETLISDAVELVKKSAERKNISISLQLDFETMSFVDPRMISTVMRNLLVNAIKFTPKNGSVAIVAQEYEDDIEVLVIDSGIGISNETIDNILNSKEILSASDTESLKSTGIGLRLSKLFVEKNKGTLDVRSKSGRGSVFSFTIPKGEQKATRHTRRMQVTLENEKPIPVSIDEDKSITILIIDDNSNMLDLLHSLFDQYYTVITASDGQSGMQIASNAVPSLIISDIAMPKVSGIDLCQALKEDAVTSKIPVILITGDANMMNEGYASGADDFIVKPFEENELMLKVHSMIENRKRLLVQMIEKKNDKGFILPESYDDIIINKLLTHVNENFCNSELEISSIGGAIGIGRTQLWRKFKSATGQNLSEYIKGLRLSKAREMLLTGKYKVSEVGYEVGFTNPAYFTKCFTKYYGYTPKEVSKN